MATIYDTSGSASNPAAVDSLETFGKDAAGTAKRWKAEVEIAQNWRKSYFPKAERTVRRYLDERDAVNVGDRRFNILWSNVQTLTPAVYTKPPKPEVFRAHDNNDQVQRVAAIIMERNLDTMVREHSLFDAVMKAVVQDRLIPGQGTAWVRYEANMKGAGSAALPGEVEASYDQTPAPTPTPSIHEAVAQGVEQVESPGAPAVTTPEAQTASDSAITDDIYGLPTGEKVCYDYVHWKDFLCSPCRVWEECTWVARRVYMTRAQGVRRFGAEFKKVPLNYAPKQPQLATGNQEFGPGQSVLKKAVVWEIWCKEDLKVYWLVTDYANILDEKADLFELPDFWPCPKPLLATVTTDSMIPTPDFCMYQDQAYELDSLTNRISMLTQALKVIGVYDKTQTDLQRLLTEGVDNTMIPVDNWAMFAERGGLKGTVDFFPVETVMNTLTQLVQARGVIKQDIYEITGLADIVRGASVASETATAQNIKAKFANIRISDVQKDIARFASDLVNITAQLITNFFQPETLVINADMALPTNPDAQYVPAALQLIKSGVVTSKRIFVSVDSITEPDVLEEKKSRVEFLQALGQFMQQSLPAAEKYPQLSSMMGHILLWGVRGFKAGRDLEGVIEQGIAQMAQQQQEPPPPTPEQQKMQAEQMQQQAVMEHEKEKLAVTQAQNNEELQYTKAKHAEELQFIHDKNQAEIEGILLKANVTANAAQNAAVQKADTQATSDEQQLQQRDAQGALDLTLMDEAHMQGMQQGEDTHAQGLQQSGEAAAQAVAQADAQAQQDAAIREQQAAADAEAAKNAGGGE